jgi:hypothetical protein
MELNIGMLGEKLADRLSFVNGEVVENDVNWLI